LGPEAWPAALRSRPSTSPSTRRTTAPRSRPAGAFSKIAASPASWS